MALPEWHPHLSVWFLLGGSLAIYLLSARRHAARNPVEDPAWRRRAGLFSAGIATLWLGADWPIHDLAERALYSMHMVQHMLFTFVAAPLLVAGTPAWMLRRVLAVRPARVLFTFWTRPLVALLTFNAVLLFTHWPEIVDASVRSEGAHFGLHLLIVLSALVMWWPVMSPLPELPALSPPGQMFYLFLQSLLPTIPASFLTFGHSLLYPVYGTFPRIWNISALTDQLLAGLTMKLVGGLILWGYIGVIFFRWHAREEREGWDAVAMARLEREIRSGASR